MLFLSTDTLGAISRAKKDENNDFISRVRGLPSKKFDELIHPLARHFTSEIDCTSCANCCRSVHVGVTLEEVNTLATFSDDDSDVFKSAEVDMDPDGKGGYLIKKPCKFLKESLCSIYDHRPSSCRSYPGLDGRQLKYRIRRIMDEYSVCPIVYHTIEAAKEQLRSENQQLDICPEDL